MKKECVTSNGFQSRKFSQLKLICDRASLSFKKLFNICIHYTLFLINYQVAAIPQLNETLWDTAYKRFSCYTVDIRLTLYRYKSEGH